jgi:hypothetical protein
VSDTQDISVSSRLTDRGRARRAGGTGNPIAPPKWSDAALHRLADMIVADEAKADIAAWFRTTPQAIWTAVSRHNLSAAGSWRACANCGGAYMTNSPYVRRCLPCKE